MDLHVDVGGSVVLQTLRVRFRDDLKVARIVVLDFEAPVDVSIHPLRRHLVDENGDCQIQRLKLYIAA